MSPLAGGVANGATHRAQRGSLHPAGCEAGWAGQRQDPPLFIFCLNAELRFKIKEPARLL
ncbi:MAG: hypothetical protein NTNFB02_29500 [Nitrospira sp.]